MIGAEQMTDWKEKSTLIMDMQNNVADVVREVLNRLVTERAAIKKKKQKKKRPQD